MWKNFGLFKLSQQVVELYSENARKKEITIKSRVYPEHEIYADSNDEAITKYHQGEWYDYSVSDFTDTHKLIEIREETE